MATALDLPIPGDPSYDDVWGPMVNDAITAVRDAADAAQDDATGALDSASERLRPRGNYVQDMAILANDLVRAPAPWGPFSLWRAKVDIPVTPAGFTADADWEYLSGRGRGTGVERQALVGVPDGYEFWDTVTAGGQLFRWNSVAWEPLTVGLGAVGGHMIAAPVAFTSAFDLLAVGTVLTDIGQQIVVPAQAGYWLLKWNILFSASTTGTNSATAGGMLDMQAQLTDAANAIVGVAEKTWLTPPLNAVRNYREVVCIECIMDPIAVDTTYKVRAHLNTAAPANFVGTATITGAAPWPASKLCAVSAA